MMVGGMMAACSCYHMALVFATMHLCNMYLFYCLCPLLSVFIIWLNRVLINQMEWLMKPACASLIRYIYIIIFIFIFLIRAV